MYINRKDRNLVNELIHTALLGELLQDYGDLKENGIKHVDY